MNKDKYVKELTRLLCEFEKLCCKGECECCEIQKFCALPSTARFLYNAGYRKVPDCAVILTPEERDEELKACNEKQAELEAEIERLKADNEALQMWNNSSAETIQKLSETNKCFESNMKSVLEIEKRNAVKEFAKKLKERLMQDRVTNDNVVIVTGVLIDEILKEWLKENE